MVHEFELGPEFAALEQHYADIDRLLERPAAESSVVRPEISAWSVEHHLAHIALANELVARNLRSLIKGSGPFVVESGDPPPGALEVLISGRLPRGKVQAPRMVQPPEVVQREYLVEWLAGNRGDFAALTQRVPDLRAATQRVPHQLLGPLSASQWLRFAAIHTHHHLEIAVRCQSTFFSL
jgi:hypothetical protein